MLVFLSFNQYHRSHVHTCTLTHRSPSPHPPLSTVLVIIDTAEIGIRHGG